MSREEAKRRNLVRYLGAACRKGHRGWRYTASQDCIQCVAERQQEQKRLGKPYRERPRHRLAAAPKPVIGLPVSRLPESSIPPIPLSRLMAGR